MADLSHWDFAERFTGLAAAALILGLEPMNDETRIDNRIHVVLCRMKLNYDEAFWRLQGEEIVPPEWFGAEPKDLTPTEFRSVEMARLERLARLQKFEASLTEWLGPRGENDFNDQTFDRQSIARWLAATGMKSVYQFDRVNCSPTTPVVSEPDSDIDPTELPPELDAANVAFRAITKGYGDPKATARNRLIDYLETAFPSFKPEQVQRIATVANPDKTTGRKKIGKE